MYSPLNFDSSQQQTGRPNQKHRELEFDKKTEPIDESKALTVKKNANTSNFIIDKCKPSITSIQRPTTKQQSQITQQQQPKQISEEYNYALSQKSIKPWRKEGDDYDEYHEENYAYDEEGAVDADDDDTETVDNGKSKEEDDDEEEDENEEDEDDDECGGVGGNKSKKTSANKNKCACSGTSSSKVNNVVAADVVEYVYEYQYQDDVCLGGGQKGEAEEYGDGEDDEEDGEEDDDEEEETGEDEEEEEYNETGKCINDDELV